MEARELRIGNYHNYHIVDKLDERKEWDEICTIDAEDLVWLSSKKGKSDTYYKPIPLSEEWLKKFGFSEKKRKACGNYWFKKSVNKLLFLTNDIHPNKGFAFSTKVDHVFIHDLNWHKKIKHVHTLQNVWYSLTGKELIIDESSVLTTKDLQDIDRANQEYNE